MRLLMVALLGLAACGEGAGGVSEGAPTSQAAGAAPRAAAGGESAGLGAGKVDRSAAGTAAPAAAFEARGGGEARLADFRGRPVLVNLWATWCAPCIAEMPALDRLAQRAGGELVVLPVSQDLEGWQAVDRFWGGKFEALRPYLDQDNELALALEAKGLPLSVLYDAEGREVWRVAGPLEWDEAEPGAIAQLGG